MTTFNQFLDAIRPELTPEQKEKSLELRWQRLYRERRRQMASRLARDWDTETPSIEERLDRLEKVVENLSLDYRETPITSVKEVSVQQTTDKVLPDVKPLVSIPKVEPKPTRKTYD
jgi:hypothetical protein